MTKTRDEIIDAAFRRIGVKSIDTPLSADEEAYGASILEGLFAELQTSQDLTITWTLDTTPDGIFPAMANYLAVEIAPSYFVAPPESRARAIQRIRTYLLTDDREDFRDMDDSGTISEAEEEAGDRSAYY